MSRAQDLIDTLGLMPHPEGGHFLETYRCQDTMPAFGATRHISTGIYYLLEQGQCSTFHRIKSDEMWHCYEGALTVHVIDQDGAYHTLALGHDLQAGQRPQHVVKAGCWFGATVDDYCLAGCTVAPGFDFADFEMADQAQLLDQYPQHQDIIKRLT